MPTFIKTGFWEKAKKGYEHWLNLDDLITSLIPSTPTSQVAKVQKTTITTAQVLQLATTPITVLNSDNPLTYKYPINVYIKRNEGDAYVVVGNIFVVNSAGLTLTSNLNSSPMLSSQVGFIQSVVSATQNLSGDTKNALCKLTMGSNPSAGTGDLEVYVTYMEITL
jgi:hypothetical protein